jgi:hypothetical protein
MWVASVLSVHHDNDSLEPARFKGTPKQSNWKKKVLWFEKLSYLLLYETKFKFNLFSFRLIFTSFIGNIWSLCYITFFAKLPNLKFFEKLLLLFFVGFCKKTFSVKKNNFNKIDFKLRKRSITYSRKKFFSHLFQIFFYKELNLFRYWNYFCLNHDCSSKLFHQLPALQN